MLCHDMLCCAMLCYAVLCYAMLCYAMLCYAMLCYAVLCCAVPCCATHVAHSAVQAQVVAKHISDYNIKAIKFSPYEEGRLMTCGKDSVRMFRLKVSDTAMAVNKTTCLYILGDLLTAGTSHKTQLYQPCFYTLCDALTAGTSHNTQRYQQSC